MRKAYDALVGVMTGVSVDARARVPAAQASATVVLPRGLAQGGLDAGLLGLSEAATAWAMVEQQAHGLRAPALRAA